MADKISRYVGIDLDSSTSALAYVRVDGNPEIVPNFDGERLTPSVVFFDQFEGIFGRMTREALCGINSNTMDSTTIRKALAQLYKRHNAAASILNPELREEAEQMLEAIVHCREKYVDA
jgi:molecular chaperone DnaK (HSP70)